MTFYPGDTVRVAVHWHAFYGRRGVVYSVIPMRVRFDGDEHPTAVDGVALILCEDA